MKRRKLILTVFASVVALAVIVNVFLTRREIRHARESVLKQDLYDLRKLIGEYTQDNQQPPASLQELVTAGYLKGLPKDPITGRDDTRALEMSRDPKSPGIIGVHSGSHEVSSEGDPYAKW